MIYLSEMPTFDDLSKGMRAIKIKLPKKEAVLEKELRYLKVQGATYNESDFVKENDIVGVQLSSKNNILTDTEIKILVGKNFYDEILEKELLGMRKNEKKRVTLEGDEVEITVCGIKEKVYSNITLEKINKQYPEVESIGEYEDMVYNMVCENIIYGKVSDLCIYPLMRKLRMNIEVECSLEDVHDEFKEEMYKMIGGKDRENAPEIMRDILTNSPTVRVSDESDWEKYLQSLSDEEIFIAYEEHILESFKRAAICLKFGEKNGMDSSEEAHIREANILVKKYDLKLEDVLKRFTYYGFKYITAESRLVELMYSYFRDNKVNIIY